jgi:hypothetical protein
MASAATAKKLIQCVAHQAQGGFVNEGRRLESLSGLLVCQALSGEAAQFGVDQRQELVGGLRVALDNGIEDVRHVRHAG